ncbi:surface lipoprotein assembly modifier [Xenorhabdus stockiae]|uniref:surface lipoprotein assembly modifier n=1 Tax=Xenorhabdus stockiae TaxID=351614 RepID=UPI003CE95189
MSDNRKTLILLTALIAFFISLPIYADEDTPRNIWQEAQHHQQENENKLITPDPIFAENNAALIVINGQKFQVEDNLDNVGFALFLATIHQQWPDVRRFLASYKKLSGYDSMLVNFAQGGLARLEENLELATYHYQQILNQQPDFPRVQLELARVYFQDHKNREAERLFSELSEKKQVPEAVLKNINSYLEAIKLRNGWRGSFSAGYAYNNNVNMSSNQDFACLKINEEQCIQQQIPKAVKAWGMSYDATISRRHQLFGNHGIAIRGLIYGENYYNYHDENENTFQLTSGYSYKNRNHDISFSPLFEYKQIAGDRFYHAAGIKTKWRWGITSQTTLDIESEHKQLRHQHNYRRKDGGLTSSYLNLFHTISKDFILFGGGDWTYRGNDQYPVDRYQQWGVRAGVGGQIYSGIHGVLFATLRDRRFGAYSPMLNAKRHDTEQIYTAVIRVPAAEIMGMTPSVTFRYRRNHSNVDWMYSYNKNEVLLRLEKFF